MNISKLSLLALVLFFNNLSDANAATNVFRNSKRHQEALNKLEAIRLKPQDIKRSKVSDSNDSRIGCRVQNEVISSIDPVTQLASEVKIKSYYAEGSNKTVLVLPPTGGVNLLDYAYANSFCQSGMNAIILISWTDDLKKDVDPIMHDNNALRSVAAVRSILMTTDENQNIGVFGTSVGGILGALVTGIEERIKVGLFLVAGAGMVDIIGESTEQNLTELREKRFRHYGLNSMEEYKRILEKKIVIDPLDFAQYTGAKKVGLMIATNDSTVPTKSQYDLLQAWGGEEFLFKTAPPYFNHIAAILHSATWWRTDITDYFKTLL